MYILLHVNVYECVYVCVSFLAHVFPELPTSLKLWSGLSTVAQVMHLV